MFDIEVERTGNFIANGLVSHNTRWHEDDLVGRLLEAQAGSWMDRWHRVRLPALNEEGEALWPAKFGKRTLHQIRVNIGNRDFVSLYQQAPAPDEGSTFQEEWMQRRYGVTEIPDDLHVVQAVDTSFKKGVGNDFSVIATWGMRTMERGVDFYLLGIWREKVEYPELKKAIQTQYSIHRPRVVYIEDAASGQSVIQDLKRNTPVPVVAVPPRGSKEDRADAVSPIFEANRVLLPEEASWLPDWLHEHLYFPSAMHDDQVDTTSLGLGQLALRNQRSGIVHMDFRQKKEEPYLNAFQRKKRGKATPAPRNQAVPMLRVR